MCLALCTDCRDCGHTDSATACIHRACDYFPRAKDCVAVTIKNAKPFPFLYRVADLCMTSMLCMVYKMVIIGYIDTGRFGQNL